MQPVLLSVFSSSVLQLVVMNVVDGAHSWSKLLSEFDVMLRTAKQFTAHHKPHFLFTCTSAI